jgi:hypothetical protein
MKILRLILFIPGFILTIFISNLLFELLVYLTNYFSSFESSPYAFIWDDFIKSIFISIASILAGLYIYPLKKKLIPLIIFTLFYIFLSILVFYLFEKLREFIPPLLQKKSFISQISVTAGYFVGLCVNWYTTINNEFE